MLDQWFQEEGRKTLDIIQFWRYDGNPVTIAERSHLFPSRTQKLSSLALMILGGTLPGKVGRCRLYGPMVKRSRHRPFTAVTGVRFPVGSPSKTTCRMACCFIMRLIALEDSLLNDSKKVWKSFKKVVDKASDTRYTNKARQERAAEEIQHEHWKLHSVEIWVKINCSQIYKIKILEFVASDLPPNRRFGVRARLI